jgi:hypothetical protein
MTTSRHVRAWFASFAFSLGTSLAFCASEKAATSETEAPAKAKDAETKWVFSLLPRSLQKDPYIDISVVTEMTDAGRKLPLPTPANPISYHLQSTRRHDFGAKTAIKYPLPEEKVSRLLTKALDAAGYSLLDPGHRPRVALFFSWGLHSNLHKGDSATMIQVNLLDRARLVGGDAFAQTMRGLFREANNQEIAFAAATAGLEKPPLIGPLNPVAVYSRRSLKNGFLVDQFSDEIYYVMASAYDYQELMQKKRVLLWRTTMTVTAEGMNEEQTYPPMLSTAAEYLGKDMPEAVIFTKRSLPRGQIEIGAPTVVEPPAKPKGEKK